MVSLVISGLTEKLTPAEEKAVIAIVRNIVSARTKEFTGSLGITLAYNQGGITGKKFAQEWTEK